jgi:hypothetical protein
MPEKMLNDRSADFLGDNLDCAIRVGMEVDPATVSVLLGVNRRKAVQQCRRSHHRARHFGQQHGHGRRVDFHPHAFGQDQLLKPLTEFLQRYPQLSIEWMLNDRSADFVGKRSSNAGEATTERGTSASSTDTVAGSTSIPTRGSAPETTNRISTALSAAFY